MPKIFVDNNNEGVSKPALWASSGLISILIMANFSEGMVPLFTFAILISTLAIFIPNLLSIAAEFKAIINDWKIHQSYSSAITGLLAFCYYCWAISGIGGKALLWGISLIVLGFPIYWLMQKNRRTYVLLNKSEL